MPTSSAASHIKKRELSPAKEALYFNQGFLEGAKKEYEVALKSEELPETYTNLAAISNKEGAKEKAESYLKDALRLNPLFEAANVNLGRLRVEHTSWWDWWFKPQKSESRLRGMVGGLLVIALILMVANMVAISFSGGKILPSDNNKTTMVQEDLFKNVTKGNSETTESKSTKTTTTDTGPSLENKMLLTALIFFILPSRDQTDLRTSIDQAPRPLEGVDLESQKIPLSFMLLRQTAML